MKLFFNGYIFKKSLDHFASALILDDQGIIIDIANTSAELKQKFPYAERIDLRGTFLFPGFTDSHNHPSSRSRTLIECDLRSTSNWTEAREHIQKYIKTHPKKIWHIVHGWNQTTWGNLIQADLDNISKNPLFLMNISYHGGIINSAGENILRSLNFPFSIKNGILKEEAFELAAILTLPNYQDLIIALPQYIQNLNALGIIASHDLHVATIDQLKAYKILDQQNTLYNEIFAFINPRLLNDPSLDEFIEYKGTHFKIQGLKIFLDGALGMHTAAISHNYIDTNTNGVLRLLPKQLTKIIKMALSRGITTIATHALGDRAVSQALDVYEQFKNEGIDISTWRLEHAEIIQPKDAKRMAAFNIAAVMQPNFNWDIENYKERLGDTRRFINPFSLLIKHHTPLLFGSDGMPDGPLIGLDYAINHASFPEQYISFENAFHAYTDASANFMHLNPTFGVIQKGAKGHLIQLDKNPFDYQTNLKSIKIIQTWFNGLALIEGD